MDASVADTIVRTTRAQAAYDARRDLDQLRRQAVEAGRERSRTVIKTTIIDSATGEIRYNRAGRLLRDWYFHVYLNTLRQRLGAPAVVIDAQQVEDATADLRRVRPEQTGVQVLHAVALARDVAVCDAASAAAEVVSSTRATGARRSIQLVGSDRFDGDELRLQVTRHWYLRVYEDHVCSAVSARQPLAAITSAEEQLVAHILQTRTPLRVIGSDGLPTVTRHMTLMTDLDRRLANGETGIVPPGRSIAEDVGKGIDFVASHLVMKPRNQSAEVAPEIFNHRVSLRTKAPEPAADLEVHALNGLRDDAISDRMGRSV